MSSTVTEGQNVSERSVQLALAEAEFKRHNGFVAYLDPVRLEAAAVTFRGEDKKPCPATIVFWLNKSTERSLPMPPEELISCPTRICWFS